MRLIHKAYDTIHSTQDKIKDFESEIKEDTFLLCTAEEQTKGRGTKNRVWLSPPRVNIYATYGFCFPTDRVKELSLIPQVAAYSIFLTLKKFKLDDVSIKWVNDVLLGGKKICGILSEATSHPSGKVLIVYLGIGLNVNMEKVLCDSLDQPVTSIKAATGVAYDKNEVLSILNNQIMTNISVFVAKGFEYFYQNISQVMAFKNEKIFFDTENDNCIPRAFYATTIGINKKGYLLLEPDLSLQQIVQIRQILRSSESPEFPKKLDFITGRILRGKQIEEYQRVADEKRRVAIIKKLEPFKSIVRNYKPCFLGGVALLLVSYGIYKYHSTLSPRASKGEYKPGKNCKL